MFFGGKKIIAITLVVGVLLTLCTFGVSAASEEYVVTETATRGIVITLEDTQAYCVERNVSHPFVGTVYQKSVQKIGTDGLTEMFIAIHVLNEDTEVFRAASQVAVWTVTDNVSPAIAKLYGGNATVDKVNEIITFAKHVDVTEYEINVEYFTSEGFQLLAVPTVKKIDKTVDAPEEIIPEPEEEILPEEKPELEPEIESEPETEDDVIPDEEEDKLPDNPVIADEDEIPPKTDDHPVSPDTGDNSNVEIYLTILIISAIALVLLIIASKKNSDNKE
jgi:hypothetical protein